MKSLIIIGARGLGRKVYDLAKSNSEFSKEFVIKGFLDDQPSKIEDYKNYPNVISSVENYTVNKNDVFVCALANTSKKKYYSKIIIDKGGKFINIISDKCIINSNVCLGSEGIIIFENSIISADSSIDNFVTIQPNVVIGHDTMIEKNCHINCFVFTGGSSKICSDVTLHTRSTILPGITIGSNTIVGACSLVNKNILGNCTVVGTPAKII